MSVLLATITAQTMAHAPYTAPNQFWIEGGNTAIVAGFAEKPFDSEVAIRGFEFQVFDPKVNMKAVELSSVSSMSFANINTDLDGTYQILGQREAPIQYAKINKKWLRILDPKGAPVPPLADRNFVTETELTAKTDKFSVTRFDEVLSYFSKNKTSDLVTLKDANLNIQYSVHPNLIKVNQRVELSVQAKNKAAQHFNIHVEKRLNQQAEIVTEFTTKTDLSGRAQVSFPKVGQYILTISSPEENPENKPQAETYRTIISLNVTE